MASPHCRLHPSDPCEQDSKPTQTQARQQAQARQHTHPEQGAQDGGGVVGAVALERGHLARVVLGNEACGWVRIQTGFLGLAPVIIGQVTWPALFLAMKPAGDQGSYWVAGVSSSDDQLSEGQSQVISRCSRHGVQQARGATRGSSTTKGQQHKVAAHRWPR